MSSVVNNEGTTKLYPDAPKPPLNQEEYEYAVGVPCYLEYSI